MDGLPDALARQPWLPATATLLGVVVAWLTFRASNRRDTRLREAVKDELEIAKLLKELDEDDGRWRRWSAHVADMEDDVLRPGLPLMQQAGSVLVVSLMTSGVSALLLLLLLTAPGDGGFTGPFGAARLAALTMMVPSAIVLCASVLALVIGGMRYARHAGPRSLKRLLVELRWPLGLQRQDPEPDHQDRTTDQLGAGQTSAAPSPSQNEQESARPQVDRSDGVQGGESSGVVTRRRGGRSQSGRRRRRR